MLYTFKINFSDSQNEWVGWFGNNVIKVKLKIERAEESVLKREELKLKSEGKKQLLLEKLLCFLEMELGIKSDVVYVIEVNEQKRLVKVELPDIAWELFLSIIEK